jgi:hypothetical protein
LSSRLSIDTLGRRIVVDTTVGGDGRVWLALGNDLRALEPGWHWLGHSEAREPSSDERVEAELMPGGRGTARLHL